MFIVFYITSQAIFVEPRFELRPHPSPEVRWYAQNCLQKRKKSLRKVRIRIHHLHPCFQNQKRDSLRSLQTGKAV